MNFIQIYIIIDAKNLILNIHFIIRKALIKKETSAFKEFSKKILIDISNLDFVVFKKYYKNQQPDYNCSVFIDKIFPPEKKSVCWLEPGGMVEKDLLEEERHIINSFNDWARPRDILRTNNYQLFEKFEVEDINQGEIGDCYFLSAISAMAEYEDRFKEIFITKKKTENGCYEIKLYINGIPKIVVLDDFIPIKNKHNPNWYLAHCKSNEIWVQLLEKAWAKINGSYASTIAGLPSEAFSVLTEAPCFSYFNKKFSPDDLWKLILDADQNQYIICTNSSGDAAEKSGIVKGHAYTIVSAYQHGNIRLLKIRNPWGNFEWNGDFSDKSSKWTEDLKRLVNFQNADDGIFYMTIEDFMNYYPYTFICKYRNNYFYEYKKFEQPNRDDFVCCKFTITKKTNAVITLHQKQVRFFRKISQYSPVYGSIILARYNKSGFPNYEFCGSSCNNQEKIHFEVESLEPGEYHIFANLNWTYSYHCTYAISCYSSNKIIFEKIKVNEIPTTFMLQILSSFIDSRVQPELKSEDLSSQIWNDNNCIGFYVMKFKNFSRDKFLSFSFDVKRNEKIYLCKLNLDGLVTAEESVIDGITTSKYEMLINKNSNQILAWRLLDHPRRAVYEINNVKYCLVSHIPQSFMHEKDEIMKFINENLENAKEHILEENLFLKEIEYFDSVIFVVLNKNPNANFMVKIKFDHPVNLSLGDNNYRIMMTNKNSHAYCLIKKLNNTQVCEYKLSYSIKRS